MHVYSSGEKMKRLITFLPITAGQWIQTNKTVSKIKIPNQEWEPLGFLEQVLDWTILPENSYGKLYAEIKDFGSGGGDIGIRLAYSQAPELHKLDAAMFYRGMFVVEGSEIIFKNGAEPYQKPTRWQLVQSEWFRLPRMPNISCLWIQAKPFYENGIVGVAFANLAIAEEPICL